MRYLRYFFIFGLSFLIFVGVFLAERAHWNLISSIHNPMDQAVTPQGEWKVLEEDQVRPLLTSFGEFFVPEVGTVIDFQTRSLKQGGGLWSTHFIEGETSSLQVGPVNIVSAGGAIFFKKTNTQIVVVAYDHALDLIFEDSEERLVLPLLKQATINLATEKVVLKDFHLEEGPWSDALHQLKEHRRNLTQFVRREPSTWVRFRLSTLWGKVLGLVQQGQQKALIGIVAHQKQELIFKHTVAPYVEAVTLSLWGRSLLAEPYLQRFQTTLQQSEWGSLQGSSIYQNEWIPYARALKSVLRNTLPEDQDRYLGVFWKTQWKTPALEVSLREVEMLVMEGSYTKARIRLEKILTDLPKMTFVENDLVRLKRFRVILNDFMQNREEFQTASLFAGYQSLLSQELVLRPEAELRAEVTPEILFWYHHFLGEELESESLEILLALYDSFVELDLVEESDKELVALVDSVKSTNLTPDRIALIRKSQEDQASFQEQLKEIEVQEEEQEEAALLPQVAAGRVSNVRGLKTWLEEQEVFVPASGFHTVPSKGVTNFSKGLYQGREASGVFDYPSQSFLIFEIGDQAHEQFHMRFLKGVLAQSLKEKVIDTALKTGEPEGRLIREGDSPALIQQRELIKRSLEIQGFTVGRSNIRALRSDLSRFQLLDVVWVKGDAMLTFVYDKKNQNYSNVKLELGGKTIFLGGQKIPVEDLAKIIAEKVKELTLEN